MSRPLEVIVDHRSAAAWEAVPGLTVTSVADEASAFEVELAGEVACLATGTLPPLDPATMVDRVLTRAGITGLHWLALTSRGVAADDGAWLDHGIYPDGPFVVPHGPSRALSAGAGGLTVLHVGRLRQLATRSRLGSLDELVARGWEAGFGSYVTPWLAAIALQRPTAPVIEPWDEELLARRLAAVRRPPTLTAVVRTEGTRPAMLRRCLASLATQSGDDGVQSVIVVGPDPDAALAATDVPDRLGVVAVATQPGTLPGRTAALLAGIAAASTDYVWFVDDDDHATPQAARRIRNAVPTEQRPIVVGATAAFEERDGAAAEVRAHNPYEWHRGLSGWNPLPNCAVVIPSDLARRRLAAVSLRHDLGEDFALQLALLTAPGSMVAVAPRRIASVSVLPGEQNTITRRDRTGWQRNLAAFLDDLGTDAAASTHVLWRLGAAIREVPERPWDGTPGDRPRPPLRRRLLWRLLPHRLRAMRRRPPPDGARRYPPSP